MQELGLTGDALERTKLVQIAMGQFEHNHGPVKSEEDDSAILCGMCAEDWPCKKMELMMLIQGFATLQAMLPTGNMSALLSRFVK